MKKKPMGIGKIGAPEIVFVRKFRWTLEGWTLEGGTSLSEYFTKWVKFDYVKKEIEFEYYEVVEDDIAIQRWVEETDFSKEKLVFTTYDGCGVPLYEYQFNDLKLLSDTSDFDYESSDCSARKIRVSYESHKRKFFGPYESLDKPEPDPPKKGFDWTISFGKDKKEFGVFGPCMRPTLNIEETEVNFLNAKTWVPGKSEWESTNLTFKSNSSGSEKEVLAIIMNQDTFDLHLHLWTRGLRKKIETWVLENAYLLSTKEVDGVYTVGIRYSNVKYQNFYEENYDKAEMKEE
jgi:hypothetical protein